MGYSKVFTDMYFITIPTVPLEQRCGYLHSTRTKNKKEDINDYDNMEDGDDITIPSQEYRKSINLPTWIQYCDSELLILNNAMCSSVSLDKITEFSIPQSELRLMFIQPVLFSDAFMSLQKR